MKYELPTEPPEEPECTYICDACGNEIDWGEEITVRDGIIIACTNCSDVMTPEDLEEQEPTKEDILADLADREYQEWKENKC